MDCKTKRLHIRNFMESDGQDLFEYLSDEEVVKFEPYKPFTKEASYAEAKRRANEASFLAVCLKEGKCIGNLYFSKVEFETWEVGYVFHKNYWGKGYATEALRALMEYAFNQLNIRRMIAMCDPENENSWKLLERVGMRREGHLRQNVFFFHDEEGNPIWKDTFEYGLLQSDFQ